MTDLRGRVVEAGARALAASINDVWAACSEFQKNVFRQRATTALDAMLDCLTENRELFHREYWAILAAVLEEPSDMLDDLVEVLREDR